MSPFKFAFATTAIASLAVVSLQSSARATTLTLDDLTTVSTFGDVLSDPALAQLSTNGLSDDDGTGMDATFNVSSSPAIPVGTTASRLEEGLGLSVGDLDPDPDNFVFAFEGSGIQQSLTVEAGDRFSFLYNFATNETGSGAHEDYAFVAIDGTRLDLATLADATQASSPYALETGVRQFDFDFLSAGTVEVAIGVVDVSDFGVSSSLTLTPVSTVVPLEFNATAGLLCIAAGWIVRRWRRR